MTMTDDTTSTGSTLSTLSVNSFGSVNTDSELLKVSNNQSSSPAHTHLDFSERSTENIDSNNKTKKGSSKITNNIVFSSSDHILITLLRPLLLCCKICGVFPIQCLKNGSIKHSVFSSISIYSFIFLTTHAGISLIFIRFMQYVLFELSRNASVMDCIAQMVFMAGQCLTGFCTMVASHFIANSLCLLWNNLQKIISNFPPRQQMTFRSTYILGRVTLTCWLIFATVHATFGIIYFWDFFSVYFDRKKNPYFIFYAFFFITFFIQMSTHLLLSMIFISICRVLQNSFSVLTKTSSTAINDYHSFLRHYKTFAALEDLCENFSRIFGFYIILEMLLTITSALVNIYFCIYITSNFHRGFSVIIPPSTVIAHAIWLFSLCNASERVQKEAGYAMKSMRDAAVYNLSSEANIQIQGILVALSMKPRYITATRFFKLNRHLITQMTAVMTTYLIFLVQFKTDLAHEDGDNDKANNTFIPYLLSSK